MGKNPFIYSSYLSIVFAYLQYSEKTFVIHIMKLKNIYTLFLFAFVSMQISCVDDDSFTSSTSNRLSFSTDTVKMDTVFSHVPTSTKTFWVYNKSGDGIRCTNVRLENGNQTGFRVNVDGSYLGESSGFQVNDIEVRNKDSIRVFVELTSPYNYKDVPQRLEDNLVFSLESGIQQKVNICAYTWDADVINGLTVAKDTTITSTKPIIVYNGIKVLNGATLTLGAGTTLYFHDKSGLDIYGKLAVNGTASDNVIFRGDRIDNMFNYLPYDNVSGQWKGIHIYESSYGNSIDYADIHSACDGIVCDSSDVSKLKLKLYNSIVHNCKGAGLESNNSVVDVENCQITNTYGDCVSIYGGGALFLNCTIAQFYPFDSNRGKALIFSNYKKDHTYPLYDFKCYNTIITGYGDDEILGSAKDSTTAYTYYFDHCLLRTPKIEGDTLRLVNNIWEDVKDTVTAGSKNFKKIDTDNLRYDFQLRSVSKAIGTANPNYYLENDRIGVRRDDKPDMGCYEYIETKKE